MEVDEEFHPYHLILIDKDETQVSGSKIRLMRCLREDPHDEAVMFWGWSSYLGPLPPVLSGGGHYASA